MCDRAALGRNDKRDNNHSMKPTICQLLHSLTVGGAEVLAFRIARELSDRYRFVFACLDDLGPLGEQLRREGFTVEVLDRQPGVNLGCMRRMMRFWRREGVALVHAHQYTPFFYAAAARGLRRWPPVLFTEHGRWFPDYPRRKRILFNRLMLGRPDRVVAVGNSVREALIRNEGIAARRIEVIYNGVDGAAFNGQPIDRDAVRREIGVAADDFVVIQVARLDQLKDHLTAIRTIQRASRQVPNVRLALVGEGPELELIRDEIRVRGVDDHVRLLGLRHDIARLLRAADLFLLTSISEGIPVTIIEAMASGLPVVSTAVGGVPEVVVPEETGLLAPAGDDAALAEAVVRLTGDLDLCRAMGERGRVRAKDVFSQQGMQAAYQAMYEEMLHV